MTRTIRWLTIPALTAALTLATIQLAAARGGGHGGHSHSSHSSSRCVGVCYGVTSTKTGLPRNTYVRGYVKKDGTAVQSYTRSP